jgi:pilus assembly protein CpaB
MARPNDRLDFFLTLQTGGRLEVVPLLSSIRILATGSRESEAPPDANNSAMLHYATMTLDVSPEEAETLVFARSKGQLTAVLRNRADQAPFKVESITDESIHAGSALSDVISLFADHGAKAGHTASPRTVEFILGGNRNGIPTVTTQIVEEGAAHTAPRSRSGRVMDVPRETQEPQPFVLPAPIIVPDPNACIGDDCQ